MQALFVENNSLVSAPVEMVFFRYPHFLFYGTVALHRMGWAAAIDHLNGGIPA
jgi:hypothetical protein